jgi:methylated-DNA-[protein]-cysteine S-methyltransferase
MQIAALSIDTPIGRYALLASAAGLVQAKPAEAAPPPSGTPCTGSAAQQMVARARAAFERYFEGSPTELYALPLDLHGSEFQRRVWRALRAIPIGATASYGEIARRVGSPGAARAVGDANRRNPIAIAVPCHRVIGGDGRLVGYAGGLARKRWLLAHEAAYAASSKSNGPKIARLALAPARSRASATASI